MPDYVHGRIQYVGAPETITATYVCSHDVGPGTVTLRTQSGATPPPAFGNVIINDGVNLPWILYDCKLERFQVEKTDTGEEWIMDLSDERWRWRELGYIDGFYNQRDPQSKFIPWTIRSPTEIVKILLERLNIKRYVIDMPPGLDRKFGENFTDILPTGMNFPQIGVNPAVDWKAESPASCLSRFAAECGRRVVYNPITRVVSIVRAGGDAVIENASIASYTPAMKTAPSMDGIVVAGDNTRFEGMFEGEAYGREWNGLLVPIDRLSYAPRIAGAKHELQVVVTKSYYDNVNVEDVIFYLEITGSEGLMFSARYDYSSNVRKTVNQIATALKAAIDAAAPGWFTQNMTVTLSSNIITFSGKTDGYAVTVEKYGSIGDRHLDIIPIRIAQKERRGWDYSFPPRFDFVVQTDRLTYEQARALAQSSVFRYYRMTGRDVDGQRGIIVPGYPVVRDPNDKNAAKVRLPRRCIVLLPTMVQQVVPEKGIANIQVFQNDPDINAPRKEPFMKAVYDGLSKDRPPEAYGSMAIEISRGLHFAGELQAGTLNTAADSLIPVDFTVDSQNHAIVFSTPVYTRDIAKNTVSQSKVFFRTACWIRDPENNQLQVYTSWIRYRPGNNVKVVKKTEVQMNIYGDYEYLGGKWQLKKVNLLEQDAIKRAAYYLAVAQYEIQTKPGKTYNLNGLVSVEMSAAIQQVTWTSTAGEGCKTIVSVNCEHDIWTPPFPVRLRAENLDAVQRRVENDLNAGNKLTQTYPYGSGGAGPQ